MKAMLLPRSVIGACAVTLALTACSQSNEAPAPADGALSAAASGTDATDATTGTPVRVDQVRADTLAMNVRAPGETAVLRQERLRAPFAGTVTSLKVMDGDRVQAGEPVASLVSRSSEAALEGAQAMVESARTPAELADARRALDLARENRVERVLEASSAGVVLSHAASAGDRVSEGDELLQIAAEGSAVMVARVAQNDVGGVRAGQPVRIRLAARNGTLDGVVHGVLPGASSEAFTAPVQIDFRNPLEVPTVGLFGTVEITVGRRVGVLSVPEPAVITDDISGVTQIALAGRDGKAHWVQVETGAREGGRVEVSGAGLARGDQVIVSGQVGLTEGAPVRVVP